VSYSLQQLAAREAIRDAARRYSRGVDRLDPDEMKSAYWPDATDHHGSYDGNAWDFADFCMKAHRGWRSTMHCLYNHSIELDPDGVTATGELYNVTYLFRPDDSAIDVWYGRYLDTYTARDGEWRISRRVCVHEGSKVDSVKELMPIDAASFRSGGEDRG
jgi:hypothetical protein